MSSQPSPDPLSPTGRPSATAVLVILTLVGITLYNALELLVIIYATFKRRTTLYFYSFLIATLGLVPQSICWLIKAPTSIRLGVAFPIAALIGWVCMVTGQSLVLYSRLHLVCHSDTKIRNVRNMIIFNAFALHIPVIVLSFGKDYANADGRFNLPMQVFEKIQISGFFIQEVIISGLYIWETVKLLKDRNVFAAGAKTRGKKMLVHLVLMNVVVLVLDLTILVLECVGLHDVQRAYKLFAYSVKLKVEFSILNKLVELTTGSVGVRTVSSRVVEWNGGRQGPQIFDGTGVSGSPRRDSGVSEVRSVVTRDDREGALADKKKGWAEVTVDEVTGQGDVAGRSGMRVV
ncbi:hypothetical protein QBC34DRAFT_460314 [Podospora aff. communis PSN243]|uniref:DUF7703 domain-containing protein n=1 Tax=Podospora aff. communis PSN243 TaxID=3040156 RepID=A0AAV9H530_9PEZI|nr:hypothetical protein QBC34DRAFT_460314 [Podospora aff. communis PSN243]